MSGEVPGWLMEAVSEGMDVPETAMHMAVCEDGGAPKEQQPQAYKREGWWPT